MYKVKSNYELKDIDTKAGVLTAYVSMFDNVDSDGDMIVKGAFDKTLSERGPLSAKPRIKHLWQHNPYDVIAVPTEMVTEEKGLLVMSKFGTDTASQDKFKQHVDGMITEYSIGYNVIKEEKAESDAGMYNKLIELKLWEYSSVTWGANSLTYTVDAKGLTPDLLSQLNDRMDKLTKALRKGTYTDETAESFEIELKQIQTIFNELIKGVEPPPGTPREPSEDTLSDEQIKELFNNFKF
jgi:HK97 family phage prohead protease